MARTRVKWRVEDEIRETTLEAAVHCKGSELHAGRGGATVEKTPLTDLSFDKTTVSLQIKGDADTAAVPQRKDDCAQVTF